MNDDNLKRGSRKPLPPAFAANIGVDRRGSDIRHLQQYHESVRQTKDKVDADGNASIFEIHGALASICRQLVQKGARTSKVPERGVMDMIREFRQVQETVNELRRDKGQLADAEEFFRVLDAKFAGEEAAMGASLETDADLKEIHKGLTVWVKNLLGRVQREKKVPPRAVIDTVREFRQTAEAVNEARKAAGAVAQAAEFLATVDARREKVAAGLGDGPRPAVALPARPS